MNRWRRLFPAMIFICSLAWILGLETHFQKISPIAPYLHGWKSDTMMQTIPIAQLKQHPVKLLACEGKQPPALDGIRAFLALFVEQKSDAYLLEQVDMLTYKVWAVVFALLNMLVFCWVLQSSGSWILGVLVAIFWGIHPAPVAFATFLEGTLLSTLTITWMLYELGRPVAVQENSRRLEWSAIACFYTRTIFQWYFFPLFFLAAARRGIAGPRLKKLVKFSILFAAPLLLKQTIISETLSTTTFEGFHKLGIIWQWPEAAEFEAARARVKPRLIDSFIPFAMIRDWCGPGQLVGNNNVMLVIFRDHLLEHPVDSLNGVVKSIKLNFRRLWEPSTSTWSNASERLPWRVFYAYWFSGWPQGFLVLASFAAWLLRPDRKRRVRAAAPYFIVVGYIFFVLMLCNRLEWTEIYRLKLFLEPALFVFAFSQAWLGIKNLIALVPRNP